MTELLASRSADELPRSITNAVRGRVSRLSGEERRLVELVSVVPNRVATSVLDAVLPDWPALAEEPERRALLGVDPRYVRFRHELARNAVRSSIPIAARRRLHAEILAALLSADADPADIVHHAEAAGAENVVAEYALVAARRAAALDSNREAYSHYRRASAFVERLTAHERAAVLEELAIAAYAVYRLEDAFTRDRTLDRRMDGAGEAAAVGRCTQILSRFYWHAGDGDAARAKALEAIEILEPLGESVELARAYSGLSQLKNLAEYNDQALEWGERALDLATRLGDEPHPRIRARQHRQRPARRRPPADTAPLLEAHAFADEVGETHEATRALGNLGYALMSWAHPEPAAPLRTRGARLRGAERGRQSRLVHRDHARVATAASRRMGGGRGDHARREREERQRRAARRQDGVGTSSRCDAATPTRPSGWTSSPIRPCARASRSASRRSSSSRPSGR